MGLSHSKHGEAAEHDERKIDRDSPLYGRDAFRSAEYLLLEEHYKTIKKAEEPFIEALLKDLEVDPIFKNTVSSLFDIHPGTTEMSLVEYVKVIEQLLVGSTHEVYKLLYRAGKNSSFLELFKLLMFCDKSLGPSKDFHPTNLSDSLQLEVKEKSGDKSLANVEFAHFRSWCESVVPALHKSLQEFVRHHSVEGKDETVTPQASSTVRPEILFALKASGHVFNRPWTKLFSSSIHGMSFENLANALIAYPAPTIIIIKDTLGNIFAGYTPTEWKEHPTFYGDANSALYCLWPTFAVYRARVTHLHGEDTENFQYLNCKSRTKSHGLGFGGQEESKRLWLGGTLDECKAKDFDVTYEKGPLRVIENKPSDDGLLEAEDFKPDLIEAYGFGGEDALKEQYLRRKEVAEIRTSRRQVLLKPQMRGKKDKDPM